jgi:hypothetical protein
LCDIALWCGEGFGFLIGCDFGECGINAQTRGAEGGGPLVFRAITYGSGRLFSPRISAGGIVSV